MARILVAGIVGGFLLFFWGFVSHVVVRIGEIGVSSLDSAEADAAVVRGLQDNIVAPGLYFIPGVHDAGLTGDAKEKAVEAFAGSYEEGPTAFLAYHPMDQTPMSPRQLGIQFVICVVAATIAALLLCFAKNSLKSYVHRVVFVLGLWLLMYLYSEVPYWVWYRFPTDFMIGVLLGQGIGFLLLGLALAAILKPTAMNEKPAAV